MDSFVTGLDCIDGRTKIPVINYCRTQGWADFIDLITEPGMCRILAYNIDHRKTQELRDKIILSMRAHRSRRILIIGHSECTGNPVPDEIQIEHLYTVRGTIKSLRLNEIFGSEIPIHLLWVDVASQTAIEIPC